MNSIKFEALLKKILVLVPILILVAVCSSLLLTEQPQNGETNKFISVEIDLTKSVINETDLEVKRNFVRQMAKEAWDGYVKYAWGKDVLRPNLTLDSHSIQPNSGQSILAAMSTLWIMDLKEEFAAGKAWIKDNLNFSQITQEKWVYNTVVEYVGGLLSCYALSGDTMFVDKAREVARALEPAYNTTSAIPYTRVTPKTQAVEDEFQFLSWIGGQHLEYTYLANLTSESEFRERITRLRNFLKNSNKPKGLYSNTLNRESFFTTSSSLFWMGRDYYQTLLKSFIQSDGQDKDAIKLYNEAIEAVFNNQMIALSNESSLMYARDYDYESKFYGNFMEYTGCYLGGMFALGANSTELSSNTNASLTEIVEKTLKMILHFYVATNLTEICHQASVKTVTGLAPMRFYFEAGENVTNFGNDIVVHEKEYSLKPDLAETYFLMYRITQDSKYRDYAWQQVQSIYQHCRIPGIGYSSITNVNEAPSTKSNLQEAYFLSGTLKYLYLIFSNDTKLPLSEWVFNSAGHPLPILKKNW